MNVILSIDPVRFPLTGIGRYTYELARALPTTAGIDRLELMRGTRLGVPLPEPSQAATQPSSPFTAGLQRKLRQNSLAVDAATLIDAYRKRQALRGVRDTLFHSPNFYLPRFDGLMVATFHDLSIFKWAECHPPERVRYARRQIAKALRRATLLITDSEFTRQEIASYFSWPLDRIRAVPLASGAEFHPRTPDQLVPRLAALGLQPGGYTLFSGTIEPRKNLATLLTAYAGLPVALRSRWPLVLCGYQGWRSAAIHAQIERGQQQGWLRYLGYVPHGDLPLLYAGARLFLFPSLYEGFGLPVLEAMASGVPVVVSSAASLPEVAGDAARICPPEDIEQWAAAIASSLEDDAWRAAAISAGRARASEFSWRRCAQETAAAYRAAV